MNNYSNKLESNFVGSLDDKLSNYFRLNEEIKNEKLTNKKNKDKNKKLNYETR